MWPFIQIKKIPMDLFALFLIYIIEITVACIKKLIFSWCCLLLINIMLNQIKKKPLIFLNKDTSGMAVKKSHVLCV